jgi:RNA polymerase sigma-70 factor (ECF subfamily)
LNDLGSFPPNEQLALARGGEPAAFAALVHAHRDSVYSLALRMLGRRDAAEDLAQDVFIQLYAGLRSIQSDEHLLFWLRKVTTHRAIDQIRQRARMALAPLGEETDPPSAPESTDPLLQRLLRRLLMELMPDARAVVTLRYQEDLDPMEIASVLDMPINTVKSHLKRSLQTLRAKMSGVQPSCEDHSP